MGNELSVQQQALHDFIEIGKKRRKKKKGQPELHWDEAAQALVEAVPKWAPGKEGIERYVVQCKDKKVRP